MNELDTNSNHESDSAGALIPVVVAALIIVGGLAFLFLFDSKANRFTNAPEAPFRTIPIEIRADVVGEASISPDGQSLAFVAGNEASLDLRVRSIEVDRDVILTETEETERLPAWSADGARIAFARDAAGSAEIIAIPFRGGAEVRAVEVHGEVADIAWAGDEIVYVVRSADSGQWSILQVAFGGGQPKRIATGIESTIAPSIASSPDNSEIVYAKSSDGETGEIIAVDLVSGATRSVSTQPVPILGLDWSLNGIIFAMGERDSSTIWTVSRAGVMGAQLRAEPPAFHPSVSADGKTVLYRRPGGRLEVVIQP